MSLLIEASPAKLRDGSWGARISAIGVEVGARIKIVTRAGKSWTATVREVIWEGADVTLVRTDGSERDPRRHRRPTCRWSPEEGSSFPCRVCGGFCFAAEEGYCPAREDNAAKCRCERCG